MDCAGFRHGFCAVVGVLVVLSSVLILYAARAAVMAALAGLCLLLFLAFSSGSSSVRIVGCLVVFSVVLGR